MLYLALWTGLAGATRLKRSDVMLHLVEFTFTKGAEVLGVEKNKFAHILKGVFAKNY